jgi:alkylhydroperoxidase/carboxymuconolactone decarboxylase family protein YurZ
MSSSPRTQRLVRLSAAIALGRWDVLRELRRSAPPGEPDRAWREVLLQAHLFAGFPRAVEAGSVLVEAGGLGTLDADELQPAAPDPLAGRALFEAVYAEQAGAVGAALARTHPELRRWIEEHAYARVLSRPGLAPALRELCAVAALAGGAQDRQLASHARGAVRLGVGAADVRSALDAIADLLDAPALARAREVVAHFTGAGAAD